MKPFISFTLILLALTLGACTQKYATMSKYNATCGYEQRDFPDFSKCIKGNNPLPTKASGLDGQKETRHRDPVLEYFHTELTDIEGRYQGKISQKKLAGMNRQAFADYDLLLLRCQEKEKQANETGAAIAAVMLVGVAAAACAQNGCGGGGYSNSYSNSSGYAGNCPCPYDLDAIGNVCGARSAWSRSGGLRRLVIST